MSKSLNITSEFDLSDGLSDIGLHFADAPMHRICFDVSEAEIELLSQVYREQVFRARRRAGPHQLDWNWLVLRFAPNVFVRAMGQGREWAEIFAPSAEQAVQLHAEIVALLQAKRPAPKPFFYMLRYEGSEFETERVDHLPEDPGDEFLQLSYGHDILGWIEQFTDRTTGRSGGLTIFEGPPGTGKTSLVSVLMQRLEKSHVFYVLPASQDYALSSAEVVPFWQAQNKRHPDRIKVIVIEDAERLLWPRQADNREAVSSVLNIADGLMGRMLRLHMLCSVNARICELDQAVMRPGRLMNQRAFHRLPLRTAQRIADIKGAAFTPRQESEDFALAEILNPVVEPYAPARKVGFAH